VCDRKGYVILALVIALICLFVYWRSPIVDAWHGDSVVKIPWNNYPPLQILPGEDADAPFKREVAKVGGLGMWERRAPSAERAEHEVRTVKLTEALKQHLDRVKPVLKRKTSLMPTVNDLTTAKRAYMESSSHGIYGHRAVEYDGIFFFSGGDRLRPLPGHGKPFPRWANADDDFSSGQAIKRGDNVSYEWDFHGSPPADGGPLGVENSEHYIRDW
jgi:hypothetical protein